MDSKKWEREATKIGIWRKTKDLIIEIMKEKGLSSYDKAITFLYYNYKMTQMQKPKIEKSKKDIINKGNHPNKKVVKE